jgi:hypothetical protein
MFLNKNFITIINSFSFIKTKLELLFMFIILSLSPFLLVHNSYFSWLTNCYFFSWPPSLNVKPKDFLNKGPMVTIFGLNSNANQECAVDQLATHLASLNLPTVIVFGPRFNSYRVDVALQTSKIKDQVSLHIVMIFKQSNLSKFY